MLRQCGEIEAVVGRISDREAEYTGLSDESLSLRALRQRQRVRAGSSADEELIEAFALVREAERRAIWLRAFDVHIAGAVAMHRRMVA